MPILERIREVLVPSNGHFEKNPPHPGNNGWDGFLPSIETEDVLLPVDDRGLPRGKPRLLETECDCGGTLRYGEWPFESSVNGERVVLCAVYHYYCSECGHRLFLPEVSDEINKRIASARKKMAM